MTDAPPPADHPPADLTYRCGTLSTSAECELRESDVSFRMRQGFNKWNVTVPLSQVSPHPIMSTQSSEYFWLVLVVSLVGIAGGTWQAITPEAIGVHPAAGVITALVSLTLLVWVQRYRCMVWAIFPTSVPNFSIAIFRTTARSEEFDTIVAALRQRATYPESGTSLPNQSHGSN